MAHGSDDRRRAGGQAFVLQARACLCLDGSPAAHVRARPGAARRGGPGRASDRPRHDRRRGPVQESLAHRHPGHRGQPPDGPSTDTVATAQCVPGALVAQAAEMGDTVALADVERWRDRSDARRTAPLRSAAGRWPGRRGHCGGGLSGRPTERPAASGLVPTRVRAGQPGLRGRLAEPPPPPAHRFLGPPRRLCRPCGGRPRGVAVRARAPCGGRPTRGPRGAATCTCR
ncbi:hypothetical protein BH18CHL1_BH18CHL1_05840 [soil metagenome]